jgi:hypothetical protein
MERMACYNFEEEPVEESLSEFEASERAYLERMRVVYSHFLLKDRGLSREQVGQLKALLYVPRCGESLVRWGNGKYGSGWTVAVALERVGHVEALMDRPCSKQRCREEARLVCCLLLLLLIVRLVA